MGLIVTDDDVLQQIAQNDAIVAKNASLVAALQPKATSGSAIAAYLSAYAADVGSWQAWETDAKKRLTGGFIFGEWVGVVADGNAAMSWRNTLAAWTAGLQATLTTGAPPGAVPAPPSIVDTGNAQNAAVASGAVGAIAGTAQGLEGSLKWAAIGLVAIAAVMLLPKRK